jgi:hypothetical protein
LIETTNLPRNYTFITLILQIPQASHLAFII